MMLKEIKIYKVHTDRIHFVFKYIRNFQKFEKAELKHKFILVQKF